MAIDRRFDRHSDKEGFLREVDSVETIAGGIICIEMFIAKIIAVEVIPVQIIVAEIIPVQIIAVQIIPGEFVSGERMALLLTSTSVQYTKVQV